MTVHSAAGVRAYHSVTNEKAMERCMKRRSRGLYQRWHAGITAPLFTFSRVSGGERVFFFGGEE
jgi:hypothetical protein